MSLVANLGPPNPIIQPPQLSFTLGFDVACALLNLGIYKDYLFGTAASGSSPIIPIRNITDLSAEFNAQSSVGGTSVQNEEVERFTSFGSGNHVFNSGDMTLRALLESAVSADVVQKTLQGPTTSSAVLNFSDTTGINDGMLFATSAGSWLATSDTHVIAHDSTTVTLNHTITIPDQSLCEFLPFYVPEGTQASSGNVLSFFSVPASVAEGMFYTNITNGTFGIRRVVSATPTTVTLDGSVNVSAGNLIYFQPPFTSGQFWTKEAFQPGMNGLTYFASELTCTVPQCAAGQNGAKRGAWPAFWMYPLVGGNGDEPDWFEFFNCLTAGSNAYTSNIHNGAFNRTDYSRTTGSSNRWSSGFYRPTGVDWGLAQHKFQNIWTADKVYRYIDNVPIISTDWQTTSVTAQQLGLDLSMGSTIPAFLQIFFYPRATAQFPVDYVVNELKIWKF